MVFDGYKRSIRNGEGGQIIESTHSRGEGYVKRVRVHDG